MESPSASIAPDIHYAEDTNLLASPAVLLGNESDGNSFSSSKATQVPKSARAVGSILLPGSASCGCIGVESPSASIATDLHYAEDTNLLGSPAVFLGIVSDGNSFNFSKATQELGSSSGRTRDATTPPLTAPLRRRVKKIKRSRIMRGPDECKGRDADNSAKDGVPSGTRPLCNDDDDGDDDTQKLLELHNQNSVSCHCSLHRKRGLWAIDTLNQNAWSSTLEYVL